MNRIWQVLIQYEDLISIDKWCWWPAVRLSGQTAASLPVEAGAGAWAGLQLGLGVRRGRDQLQRLQRLEAARHRGEAASQRACRGAGPRGGGGEQEAGDQEPGQHRQPAAQVLGALAPCFV